MPAVDEDRAVAEQIFVDDRIGEHGAARVLALGVVLEHEALAALVEEIGAEADQRIQPLRGKALGRQRGLDEFHVGERGAGAVAHRLGVAGIVGEVPAVEGKAGGVARDAVDVAGGHRHRLGADRGPGAVAEVEGERAIGAVVLDQKLHRHRARQHGRLAGAHMLADAALEVGAVEIDVIGAGQAEGAMARIVAGLGVLEVDAHALDLAQDARHLVDDPRGHRHVDDAVGQIGKVLEQELRRVPFGTALHDGEVVVDAAADAAAIVEHPALLADRDGETRLQRRDRRHAAGNAAADDEQIRVDGPPVLLHSKLRTGQSRAAPFFERDLFVTPAKRRFPRRPQQRYRNMSRSNRRAPGISIILFR